MATFRHPHITSDIEVRKPHARLFMRRMSRGLGYGLLILGVGALAYDAVAAGFQWPMPFRSTWAWWAELHRDSLDSFTRWAGSFSQAMWDSALHPALLWPAFAAPLALGSLLWFAGRRRV